MQARLPPKKVILIAHAISAPNMQRNGTSHLQIRVYARDLSLLESFGKRQKPAVWLPFLSIFSPEFLVGVAQLIRAENKCALRDKYLADGLAVLSTDGVRQRQYYVFRGSDNIEVRMRSGSYG